jgi:hypothetical protein
LKSLNISLPIETILEVSEQLGYLIPQVVELLLQGLELSEEVLDD